MLKLFKVQHGAILAALAAASVALVTQVNVDVVLAQSGPNKRATPGVPTSFATTYQSIMRISDRESFPMHRAIKIARNKSMLLELPRDLRDVIVSNPEILDAVVQTSNRVYLIGKKTGQGIFSDGTHLRTKARVALVTAVAGDVAANKPFKPNLF